MKKLLTFMLLFPLFLFSFDYAAKWTEVESLHKQLLPESALKIVQDIYVQAKENKNSTQFIRATLYKKNYTQTLSENGQVEAIKSMENAINEAVNIEEKLILTSVLAELYANYLDQRYYEIRNRTIVKDSVDDDINTWTIEQLVEKTSSLYLTTLKPIAQNIGIEKYKNILNKGKYVEGLYPTLYDLLAFRALNYFKNSRYRLNQFNQGFKLSAKNAFTSAEVFRQYPFIVNDSLKYNVLLIYQKLLNFHKNGKYPLAQRHIDLERLFFVSNNLTESTSNEEYSYEKALKNIISQHPQSEALYFLADYYVKKNDYINAMKYAQQGINSNNYYTKKLSLSIKNNLEERSLQITMEAVNLPQENILASLHYRNIDKLYVKVLKLNTQQRDNFFTLNDKKEKLSYIKTLKSFKHFEITFKKDNDYKEHGTEFSLGAYGLGEYLFLFSDTEEFEEHLSYEHTQVSNIAHLVQSKKLLLIDRKKGTPLAQVKASFYATQTNSVLAFVGESDSNGFIDLAEKYTNGYQNYQVIFEHKDDKLHTRINAYRHYQPNQRISQSVYFFTDRSIYRPSQTLYFKGLAVQYFAHKKPKVLSNTSVTVTFLDKNHQKINSKKFKTDEYGTFHGEFRTPSSGLLGLMQLNASIGGNSYVHVEEYKRPKFEVNFNKLEKSYVLGDNITFTGKAKAYAGNGIANATVKYTVKREARFPWRCYWEPMPYSSSKIIKKGKVKTDSNGDFSIDFEALKQDELDSQSPNYYYTLHVDVTDTTGETHGSSKSIELGTVGIKASMLLEDELNVEENKTLRLETSNLDGKFQALQGEIIIKKQANKKYLYKKRYWSTYNLDRPIYNEDEFTKLFPNYQFMGMPKTSQENIIKTLAFDTKVNTKVDLGSLEQGEYILTLNTSDKNGIKVSSSKKLTVYDLQSKKPHITTKLWHKSDKKQYQVGDKALLNIKSSHNNLAVLLSIQRVNEVTEEKWVLLSGLHQELINIKDSDQGDIRYQLNFVKENRAYHERGTISIPWDTELKVEYLSFRDKLKPNEKEQWKVKISGKGKEKLMAQMVATMYDASLDALAPHKFYFPNLFPHLHTDYASQWKAQNGFTQTWLSERWLLQDLAHTQRIYPTIKWLDSNNKKVESDQFSDAYGTSYPQAAKSTIIGESGGDINPVAVFEQEPVVKPIATVLKKPSVTIRKNLKETMFFKPNLQTDKEGSIIIDFKTNEALTRWNFMAFVHTKDLRTAVTKKTLTTSKELMVVTNLPRFFREKDEISLSAKVVNMSDKDLNGTCELKLVDPVNEQPLFERAFKKTVSIKKGASTVVEFKFTVPDVNKVSAIKHTIIAKTATHSDAEQIIKPILSNRVFITESKNMSLKAHEEKSFTLASLKNNNSKTLKNHKLTLEFTANPAWYAIKSLPYLMEYPHECNEQLFNRYFANALAAKIANSSPKIKEVFENWKSKGELISALETNAELKSVLLEETPWVLNAKNQAEQQANLGILFDLIRLAQEEKATYNKLIKRQFEHSDGGWSWFESPHSNWYITQYIVEGFGKLKKLGIDKTQSEAMGMATNYIDNQMLNSHKKLLDKVEQGQTKLEDNHLNSMLIHYLYARSFYSFKMLPEIQTAHDYYLEQAKKYWTKKGLYEQSMIALTLNAKNEKTTAINIVKSLKERALVHDDLGMYFKYNNGYYWNQMPLETHALLIDVFHSVANDEKSVELMKTWLLKNKQTTHWKTTKATASAIYALLSDGKWLQNDKVVEVNFDTTLPYKEKLANAQVQAGTGYFKTSFKKFDKSMATLTAKNPNDGIAWGALYWQYFEEMDKVKSFKQTPLNIKKKLYLIEQTNKGEVLSPITNQVLKVGDKVKIRIELRVDRNMEYIMLKDTRASAFEPVNVLSQYKYQDGLGYYESTKDNATYFFMDYLPKGTYVFEYPLLVTHKGDFSNGITSIESMYAPEFKSHSEGVRVLVE